MATFDDPEDAFQNTKQRIRRGNAFLWLYKVDERLRGFEIIVASSNNRAVENVSAELPGNDAVAADAFQAGYFKTTSDALLGRETWGLIAAVLGNASNRSKFRQQFWWDDDTGMLRYLQHATGTPTMISVTGKDGRKYDCLPIMVTNKSPPSDKNEALRRWKTARQRFRDAYRRALKVIDDAKLAADLPKRIHNARVQLENLKARIRRVARKRAINRSGNFRSRRSAYYRTG